VREEKKSWREEKENQLNSTQILWVEVVVGEKKGWALYNQNCRRRNGGKQGKQGKAAATSWSKL